MEFKIGDRVKIYQKGNYCYGKYGTVVGFWNYPGEFYGNAKVILDDKDGCSNFGGELPDRSGLLVDESIATVVCDIIDTANLLQV